MTSKVKSLHNIVIEGCNFNTQLNYNLNTDHITIGTIRRYSKKYQKIYRENNKEKHKEYRKDNKVKIKEKKKQYNKNNKDKIKAYNESHRNPNTPRFGSEEYRINMSCSKQGINKENFNGFTDKKRLHVLPINQCIQLNSRFKGSEGHHIMSGVVIFIPKDLHKSVWHDLKNNKNMKEINKLALNYLLENK